MYNHDYPYSILKNETQHWRMEKNNMRLAIIASATGTLLDLSGATYELDTLHKTEQEIIDEQVAEQLMRLAN